MVIYPNPQKCVGHYIFQKYFSIYTPNFLHSLNPFQISPISFQQIFSQIQMDSSRRK